MNDEQKKEVAEEAILRPSGASRRPSVGRIDEGQDVAPIATHAGYHDLHLTCLIIDNHFYLKVGCNVAIVHGKEGALKWLAGLWDQHIEPLKPKGRKRASKKKAEDEKTDPA